MVSKSLDPADAFIFNTQREVDIEFTESNDNFPTWSHLVHGSAMIFVGPSQHQIELSSSVLYTKNN